MDENGDTKVTLEEVLGFRNFKFAEDLEKVALGLGQSGDTVSYLVSGGQRSRYINVYGPAR